VATRADIGGGVNILDYVTIAGGTGTGTLLMIMP